MSKPKTQVILGKGKNTDESSVVRVVPKKESINDPAAGKSVAKKPAAKKPVPKKVVKKVSDPIYVTMATRATGNGIVESPPWDDSKESTTVNNDTAVTSTSIYENAPSNDDKALMPVSSVNISSIMNAPATDRNEPVNFVTHESEKYVPPAPPIFDTIKRKEVRNRRGEVIKPAGSNAGQIGKDGSINVGKIFGVSNVDPGTVAPFLFETVK